MFYNKFYKPTILEKQNENETQGGPTWMGGAEGGGAGSVAGAAGSGAAYSGEGERDPGEERPRSQRADPSH